ncbi:hypothetical protein, partial [Salmonella enterica]|uniref:hypothetical protein n=1 Tax=Salmonella enterica TaxID=28901 RepID=UPI00256FF12C
PQNDVTLKMPAFEWVHVQLHQQKGMISLSPPTICNSAILSPSSSLTNETSFNVTVRMLRTNSSLCGISSPLCDFYSASATRFIGS